MQIKKLREGKKDLRRSIDKIFEGREEGEASLGDELEVAVT